MKLTNGLKVAAVTITSLYFASLFLLTTEMTFINIFSNVIFLGVLGFIMWGAWKSPRSGGLLLITFSIIFWIYPIIFKAAPAPNGIAILLTAPLLFAGLLFLLAAWKTPKTTD